MDWQIRIALIILGIGVIGFIFYDYNRRKKNQNQKQRLIDQMRESADQVDRLGFDFTGVGNVRKASDELNTEDSESEMHENVSTSASELVAEPIAKFEYESQAVQNVDTNASRFEAGIADSNTDETMLESVGKPRVISSPTEQMSLADLADEQAEVDLNAEPDLVFSLILKATEGTCYKGHDFMPILLSQGLRHGDMGIFHRLMGQGKNATVLYSVANAINPGTFDIKNIQNFETPAFAFFMTVPGPKDPMIAYEGMVKTIKLLKQELNGQILDETKSVFTEQTYRHQKDVLQQYLIKKKINR
jgi:cell division protein ZipA